LANAGLTNFPPILSNLFPYHVFLPFARTAQGPDAGQSIRILNIFSDQELLPTREIVFKGVEL